MPPAQDTLCADLPAYDEADFDEDFDEDFDSALDEEFERELAERFKDEDWIKRIMQA